MYKYSWEENINNKECAMIINKIKNDFIEVCDLTELTNRRLKRDRFYASFSPDNHTTKQTASYCLYDRHTKKYIIFDTIMLDGHYGYSKKETPKEFHEMKRMLQNC